MRVSTAQLYNPLLKSITKSYSSINQLNTMIASNKKIMVPSDNPIGSAQLIGLKRDQAAMAQYMNNIDSVSYKMNRMETQYETMTNMLDRMQELVILAGNGTNSADDLKGIADEMDIIKEGLLAAVNQRDENGSSLFGGSQVKETPLVKDAAGNYVYHGDALQKQVMVGSGVNISLGQGADSLFLSGGDYFKGVDDLIDKMRNADPTASAAAGDILTQTKGVQTNISSAQGDLGSKQNLMSQMSASHIEMSAYNEDVTSQLETLELPDAMMQLVQFTTALQMQQQIFGKIQNLSLFQYV